MIPLALLYAAIVLPIVVVMVACAVYQEWRAHHA